MADNKDYGLVAIKAYNLIIKDNKKPRNAWKYASKKVFCNSESSQNKSCPMCSFLGICSEGILIGVDKSEYTTSVYNKKYAIDALTLIKKDKAKYTNYTSKELWEVLTKNYSKKIRHNSQMDVVLALVKNGLINWELV